ncbi:glycosyltransferase [Winogradskyella undariae]|uniref:glycosyltransferase n=1 Tax=Winogradskyella undariae TaxID=1285465 RepID=UPI0015C8388A|nr:glycosyltransferase [Winogradskyella undariae]
MVLTIISHTEHYYLKDGTVVGWGPTVTEINYLSKYFDSIYHLGMIYKDVAIPPSALPYTSSNIHFIPLPALGGQTFYSKMLLVFSSPKVISTVRKYLNKSDWFQLRTPTGIGVYLIPYLTVCSNKSGWFKYAGNWNQQNPPLGYRLQQIMLKKQSRKVTINGNWEGQLSHCLTFENPCLSKENLIEGTRFMEQREFPEDWSFCYVGRLEREKGVERIIKAIASLSEPSKNKIKCIHLVGDGSEKKYFEQLAESSGVLFKFYGFLSRNDVFEIYKKSQVFIMPTQASEGFPKVIAEAMNYGCIPLVSDVSSISQYIKHSKNGYIIKNGDLEHTKLSIEIILEDMSIDHYRNILDAGRPLLELFSFQHYQRRILYDIINNDENS